SLTRHMGTGQFAACLIDVFRISSSELMLHQSRGEIMKCSIPVVAAAVLCVLASGSSAQVAAPTKIIPGSTSVPTDLPPGVQAPEAIGFHGCSGYPSLAA